MHRLFRQWISRALIVIAVIFLGVLVNKDNRAVQYISKCKRVEPGMTLEQAKRIMGGHEGDYQMRNKGQIEYIHPLFAQEGTFIVFNSDTNIVTEVVCGNRWYSGFDE
jgi:hypothetical protein